MRSMSKAKRIVAPIPDRMSGKMTQSEYERAISDWFYKIPSASTFCDGILILETRRSVFDELFPRIETEKGWNKFTVSQGCEPGKLKFLLLKR